MAQIIKHRRGSISALKDVTANIGELVMGTGSIGDLNAPVLFIGDTAVAGGYKPVSKIYQGSSAPTISVGSHGSTMDGVPFYSTNTKTLFILDKGGNNDMDLTGNIEGNTISGVTINNLTGTTINLSNGGNTALNIVGNIVQTGSFYTSGDIVLRGNINIGDNLTGDTLTLNSEISSSLIPDVNNAFNLGTAQKSWGDLHVSGTAYVNVLQANQVNFTDLGILEDLSVSGNTYLGNGGDILVVSGSIYNDQLTQKRLVVVGADGLLTNYSGLTFDNNNLNLSGALEVTNIQGTGSLYLKPDLNDGRDFRIYNTAPSDIHIKGNASYSFFGDDTNYLKIDDGAQTVTIDSTNGIYLDNNTSVNGNLYVSGNLEVFGTATNVNLESNTVNIGDNIIQVNAYTPFDRYAGLSAYDSGSAGLSGSFLWDAINDYWLVQYSNGNTGKIVSVTTGSMGSETSLTNGTIPIATSNGTIGNSLLTYSGTTLVLNTNKFSVNSGTGDTTITGNLTLSYSGGTDNALSSSAIVFRNSSNILGYVSTTATTDVMDGILGYKNSNGALVFSTVIDGGSYV